MQTFIQRAFGLAGLALLVTAISYAQDIAGDWQGMLDTGQGQLHLVLHLTKAANGGLGATLDSVDQGSYGIPIATVSLKDSKLSLGVEAVNGSYEGTVKPDGSEIDGTWTQGQSLPLNFKRAPAAPAKAADKPAKAARAAKPSDIDGTWQGTLDTGQSKLTVVVHITNTEDGLTATMDSPDQNTAGIPVTSVTRAGAALTLESRGSAANSRERSRAISRALTVRGARVAPVFRCC
ncbi:MAG TPA: hypothetical protein VGZ29_16790 [Terriglobia bacterium]|nr:hypothetical protein [Terriglobia bacterium]